MGSLWDLIQHSQIAQQGERTGSPHYTFRADLTVLSFVLVPGRQI